MSEKTGSVSDEGLSDDENLRLKALVTVLSEACVIQDSYGVQGSEFSQCLVCGAGGAPGIAFKHTPECAVGRAEATAERYYKEYTDEIAEYEEEEKHLRARIKELEAAHSTPDTGRAGVYDPSQQPFDEPLRHVDPKCTDCGGTGVTYQTERRCACQPDTKAEAYARLQAHGLAPSDAIKFVDYVFDLAIRSLSPGEMERMRDSPLAKLISNLQSWRDDDHADEISLNRNQVITIIEGARKGIKVTI